MSLFDKPQLDLSAVNCAASEISIQKVLCESNGFISRKEVSDKGCDFMCELVDESSITGYKFPLQLKSIENVGIVDNGKYISYPLLTSRLGYMLSHLPTTGIIVLYNVKTNELFYDFSDSVYQRIMLNRGSDDWTHNESVNIRIPIANKFDADSVKKFHVKILERFRQAVKMQIANGKKYNLPCINLTQEFQYDFNNIEHLKLLLKRYGLMFLDSYDLTTIYKTISKLTTNDINSDAEISMLAAISYSEVGRFAESDIFVRKLKVQNKLSEPQKRMIGYLESKNQLALGLINSFDFLERLKQLRETDPSESVVIDINILRYKLIGLKIEKVDRVLKTELKNIFKMINQCDATFIAKQLYSLWNSENEALIISHDLTYNIGLYKMKSAAGTYLSLDEKRLLLEGHINDEREFYERVNTIYRVACQNESILVQATALLAIATYFTQNLISFIGQGVDFSDESQLKKHFEYAFQAYQLYFQLGMLKDSHYSVSNAIEILEFAKVTQGSDVSSHIEKLKETKTLLEKELLLPSSPSLIISLLEEIKANREKLDKQPAMYRAKEMDDHEIILNAQMAIKAYNLPDNRLENVINELKAYRLFYNRCQDPSIKVLQSNYALYQFPVEFTLLNIVSNAQTKRSSDMEVLLQSLGL